MRLIRDGKPNCVVVLDEAASDYERLAASELQYHLGRAAQAEIEIVSQSQAGELDQEVVRLVAGGEEALSEVEADGGPLEEEEYAIRSDGNRVLFCGRDTGSMDGIPRAVLGQTSPGTLFAVYHFLDHWLGVRWLWPGETGTHVPLCRDLDVPPIDVRTRPTMVQRRLQAALDGEKRNPYLSDEVYQQVCQEEVLWGFRHLQGSRTRFVFGHSFADWWENYHEDHPEYFAVPPPGYEQPYPREGWVKLCVSNPGVVETILAEWRSAGRPETWCVGPNDGSGWCTCGDCRALDADPGQDPEDIWLSRGVNLTRRYTTLWNKLLKTMRGERPDVTLTCFAYATYRDALPDTRLEDGMVLAVVHTYGEDAKTQWGNWARAGAQLYMRPNWFHMGGCAPHIPLHRAGDCFRFAQMHSMIGYKFDTVMGYWATQGPFYYLIGRLGTRPDLSVDDVIGEYCSCFGNAAPAIERYLTFWEDFTEEMAVPVPAGGAVTQNADGLHERACRELEIGNHPLHASWRILPVVYTDEVLGRALAILEEADGLAEGEPDPLVGERIDFLREGLQHLARLRDVIDHAYREGTPDDESVRDAQDRYRELLRYQADITTRHVVWGPVVQHTLERRGIRTTPEGVPEPDLDGV